MTPEQKSKVLLLIHSLLDGQLTDAQRDELNDFLRFSPEARDQYIELSALHSCLERTFGSALTAVPAALIPNLTNNRSVVVTKARRISYRDLKWIVVSCAVSLVVVALSAWWITVSSNQTTTHIATLILEDRCRWDSASSLQEGKRLTKQKLSLSEGTAMIRMDSGTEIIFAGSTDIELLSADSLRLLKGKVHVRGLEGFKLSTAACDVIDLGTEFSVSQSAAGSTKLHVQKGQVFITNKVNKLSDQIVEESEIVQVNDTQDLLLPASQGSPDFQQLFEKAASNLVENALQAHEGFSYSQGIYSPVDMNGGTGWSGSWRLRNSSEYAPIHELNNRRLVDSSRDLQIRSGNLMPGSGPEAVSGRLHLPPGRHYRLRDLQNPIDMGNDGITYVSLQFHQPLASASGTQTTIGHETSDSYSFRITFRCSKNYWDEKLLLGLKNVKFPSIHISDSWFFESAASLPSGKPLLWTAKIIRNKSNEDEIYFRIYTDSEQVPVLEPSNWHLVAKGVKMHQALDTLVVTSISENDVEIDEICIGPNWRSVTHQFHSRKLDQ